MSTLKLDYSPGDVLAEKYEVVERLEETPLGVGYRARHTRHGTYVRLLLLDPKVAGRDAKQSIIDAFKLARDLEHRSLLKIGELGQHEGVAFVTMEDFEGASLRAWFSERRAAQQELTLREAAQITIRILEAAQVLQDKGVIARAIRPEHVVIAERRTGPRGANVVLDVKLLYGTLWGLVPPGMLAEEEFTRGEAQYIAPELKTVDPTPVPQSDVYSAGVIFYELLTGAPPMGTYQLPRQRRPDLPQRVDDVVELALAPHPSDRYPTPTDFITDVQRTFQEAAGDEGSAAGGVSWVVWALAALLVVAVGVLAARRTAVNPWEEALVADQALRKQVFEQHPRPSVEEVNTILDANPPNMMLVPGGPYITGRLGHEPPDVGGKPASITEVGGFLIDVFEYPNLRGGKPRFGVTFDEAKRLCDVQGKRLCSAAEFEKACRGPENYVYSYGDAFDPEFCGSGIDDIHLSGLLPDCKSSWGVYDIAGNFREWTGTLRGDSGRALVKGGLPQSAERGTRCDFGRDEAPYLGDPTISFRCCRDLEAGAWTPPTPEDMAGPPKEDEHGKPMTTTTPTVTPEPSAPTE